MKYLCTVKGENRQSTIVSLLEALNISPRIEIVKNTINKDSKTQESEFDISIPENQHEDAVKLLSQNGLIGNEICYIKDFEAISDTKKQNRNSSVWIILGAIAIVSILVYLFINYF